MDKIQKHEIEINKFSHSYSSKLTFRFIISIHRFNKAVELIFDNMEEVNMEELNNDSQEENNEMPPEILIQKYQLQELQNETAKLKSMVTKLSFRGSVIDV